MIPDASVNIWARTKNSLYALYEKRAAGLAEEMDCHAQAAEIYAPYHQNDWSLLDAGGGSGYFYHSLKKRNLRPAYYLLDYNFDFVEQGRRALEGQGAVHFLHQSIQQCPGRYEAVFCLNALFCLPDYRQGLERLLLSAEKMIVIRSAFGENNLIRYEKDEYLDPGAENLKSYFNIWSLEEINAFVGRHGFKVSNPIDRRTNDSGEMSAGKFFPWRWVVGLKE